MANNELKAETLSATTLAVSGNLAQSGGTATINATGAVAIDASTTVVICGTTGTPTIGRAGVTTSNSGALTVAQALTAQGNLAQSGGTATINATGAVAIDASTTLGICTTAGTPTISRTGVTTTIGGPVALTSSFMTWAEGNLAPLLMQSARTTDATPFPFRIYPQAPFGTATGTNRTPASFAVSISLPTNSGTTEGFFEVQRNTSTQLQLGYSATNFYTGNASSVVQTPTNVDFLVAASGSGRLLFDSVGNAQALRGSQWLFHSASNVVGLTIVAGATSSLTGGATSWTLDAGTIINIGTITATSIKIGRTAGALGFYGATPLAKATADGTLGNLITILRDRGLIG